MAWPTCFFHCRSCLEFSDWYQEVCEFSRREAKEEEPVQGLRIVCAGRDDEITRVFVDRITRSGKSTKIKAKPKRNRKHMKWVERRTKPHPVRHRRRQILNNYSNSLTLKSGCIFVVVPPTMHVSPPPFLCTNFPRQFTVFPFLHLWGVHISCLLFTVSHHDLWPKRNIASRWWSSPLSPQRCWPP